MPYKPTGRPPGRPRKHPKLVTIDGVRVERAAPVVSSKFVPMKERKNARKRFRLIADMLNPSKAVQVLDSRGRPRHKPSISKSRMM